MQPGPAVAQQLGPMGINLGKVISDVNEATKSFKGVNVPVHLDIDPKDKSFSIKVLTPPTSELIKKELGIETASEARTKTIVGNLAIEQVIAIAKTKHDSMLSNDFLSSVNSVLGTCMSLGVLVEDKIGKEVQMNIKQGKWKEEIQQQKTEPSQEKIKKIKDYFAQIQSKQQKEKQAEEEAKAAEEAKATEAATAKPGEKTEDKKEEKPVAKK